MIQVPSRFQGLQEKEIIQTGKNLENYTILATGLILIILFAISSLIIGKEYISGISAVLVFNGLMIESRLGPADFGLITPVYIFAFLILFSLLVYFVFGKPNVRVANISSTVSFVSLEKLKVPV